jgi:hypothetical protein
MRGWRKRIAVLLLWPWLEPEVKLVKSRLADVNVFGTEGERYWLGYRDMLLKVLKDG